jgi:indolepyruvate ferredoxin oxidoreductase beta subunit
MKVREFNMIVAGVGGQGSVLASHIIAAAAIAQGLKVRVGETFGASQRGGKVHSHVRIGEDVYGPLCPERSLNVLLGLEPNETLRLAVTYAKEDTCVITNTHIVPSMDVNLGADEYPSINQIEESLGRLSSQVVIFDATSIALKTGNTQTMNVVMLGALASSGQLPYESNALRDAVIQSVPPRTREVNLKAFSLGWEALKTKK